MHIPGTAGTSIEHALSDYQSGRLINISGGIWVSDENTKKKIKDLFGEDVSNNSKHLTAHQWKEVLGDKFEEYYKFTIVRNPHDKVVSLFNFNKKKPNEQPKWVIHQSMFLTNNLGDVIVDDIFKFEELEESWKIICKKLNIDFKPLPHKNKRNLNNKKINTILSREEITKLNEELSLDFELLGYK